MLRALLYLRLMSMVNWVRWRARRLRQPKYLAGAIVGVAYIYFFFIRRLGAVRPMHGRGYGAAAIAPAAADLPAEWLPIALAIGALVLLVALTFMWVVPTQRAALGFSEAEIVFLFPAPVSRGLLVHFRLLTAQLRSLVAALVMALISNRWTVFGGNALTHALGWWFIFSALNLHFTGAKFMLTRAADVGRSVAARRAVVVLLVAGVIAVTLARVSRPAVQATADPTEGVRALGAWLVALTSTAPLSWPLYPLRLVLGPFVAADTAGFLRALAPAFVVIAVHYLWVVRAVVSFEDASIAQAEKRTARLAAWRSGERRIGGAPTSGRSSPFALRGGGRPEVAFLWKNLLSAWPYFKVRTFAAAAAVIVAGSLWAQSHPGWRAAGLAAGAVAGFVGGYILVIGPHFARQDIRSDLRKLDVLRTYPLAGWQVVLGELLAPAAILTGLVWLALLAFFLNVDARAGSGWTAAGVRFACGAGAASVVPPLAILELLVPNAAALMFPGWAEATRLRGGGPEVMGQRMIYLFAQLLATAVALLPAAIVGYGVIVVAQFVTGPAASVLIATVPVLLVLLAEVAVGVWWLGGRFEKLDLAEDLHA